MIFCRKGNIERKFNVIISLLQSILRREIIMSAAMDALKVQGQAISDEITKVVIPLLQQLAAGKEDPVAIQAVTDQLAAATKALSDEVTSVSPPVPPEV